MTADRPRVREWGLAVGSVSPGPRNAITDVAGVRVGHTLYAVPLEALARTVGDQASRDEGHQ